MARQVILRDDDGPQSSVFGRATLPDDHARVPAVLLWRGDYFVPGGIQDGQETYRKAWHIALADDAVTI